MMRATRWIVGIMIVVVLAIGAAIAGEAYLRTVVPDRVASEVRSYLSLSDDHPVDVHTEGLLVTQLIGGALKNVRVDVANAPITEDIRGDLFFATDSLPTSPSERELGESTVGVRFDADELDAVLQLLSRGIGQELVVHGDALAIENSFTIFGARVPLRLAFDVSVNEGQVHVDPQSIDAGPLQLTAEQIQRIPALSDVAFGFDVCIADQIPAGVTLDEIELSTTQTVRATATLDPRLIIDPELQLPGEC